MGQVVRADMIKRALAQRHSGDSFFTEVKNGPTHWATELLIMDAVAFKRSWANPCIMGYEIKVSRSDFLGDEKWRGYLPYCNRFSFVCPRGIIELDELPDDIGLIFYNPDKETLYTRRKATYREIDPPLDMMMYLVMQTGGGSHPFFSNKREYFEAFVEDKASKRDLGYRVGKKLGNYIMDLQKEVNSLQLQVKRNRRDSEIVEDLKRLMNKHRGTDFTSDYKLVELVEDILKTGMPPEVARHVLAMDRALDAIKALVDSEVS